MGMRLPGCLAAATTAALLSAGCASVQPADTVEPALHCPAPGTWEIGGRTHAATTGDVLDRTTDADVVLLGEVHDRGEDHRWQLHLLSALHARHADMAIGLEMLPTSRQPALDRWLDGDMDRDTLLAESGWFQTWGFSSDLYLPLLDFARMHRVPLHALNAEHGLVQRVAREGWGAIAAEERHQLGRPAEISDSHRRRLAAQLETHPVPPGMTADDYLEMFVRGQTARDRAMAEALANVAETTPGPVVGLVGRGHLEYGHGIPHQLADLGVANVVVLLPHRPGDPCVGDGGLPIADALFGIADGPRDEAISVMRLGITISENDNGLRVDGVADGSIAAGAGLRTGDVLESAAGRRLADLDALLAALDRQRPGTALILGVRRDGSLSELAVPYPQP